MYKAYELIIPESNFDNLFPMFNKPISNPNGPKYSIEPLSKNLVVLPPKFKIKDETYLL